MKVVIIGGGVAGLAAGIYAQRCGFVSEIYEKNPKLGGFCSYWRREGFLLDNCVHWLVGTNPKSEMYKVWEELGVLGNGIMVHQHPSFFQVECEDLRLVLWNDIEQTRKEMKELSPEDEEAIDDFIDDIERCKDLDCSIAPPETKNAWDDLKDFWRIKRAVPVCLKYQKMSIEEYAKRFRHPLLRKFCTCYLPETYSALAMLYTYAMFVSGNGGVPEGGSKGIIDRMAGLYHDLGGKIYRMHEVREISVIGRRAEGVYFEDGSSTEADWIIAACDTYETFKHLLDGHYTETYFKDKYEDSSKFRVFTSVNCYYASDVKAEEILPQITTVVDANLIVFGKLRTKFLLKHFDYEPSFAPQGKSVLQVLLVNMFEDDYDLWKNLYDSDREKYWETKNQLGEEVMETIVRRFPEMHGKIHLLDVVTPVTNHRMCKAYKGAYMSFTLTPEVEMQEHDGRLKDVDNVLLAGQWLEMSGGLSLAATSGRYAIQRLCKETGRTFFKR